MEESKRKNDESGVVEKRRGKYEIPGVGVVRVTKRFETGKWCGETSVILNGACRQEDFPTFWTRLKNESLKYPEDAELYDEVMAFLGWKNGNVCYCVFGQ